MDKYFRIRRADGQYVNMLEDCDRRLSSLPSPERRRQHATLSEPESGTPVLRRSNSFDSQASMQSTSPRTPGLPYRTLPTPPHGCDSVDSMCDNETAVSRRASYEAVVPSDGTDRSESSDSSTSPAVAEAANPQKRFPCNFPGCGKFYTTSGHASRHFKSHNPDNRVMCPIEGCNRLFSRNDNMKQHMSTHLKAGKPAKPSKAKKRATAARNTAESGSLMVEHDPCSDRPCVPEDDYAHPYSSPALGVTGHTRTVYGSHLST